MSIALMSAIAETPAADIRPVSAAELAARIPVPVRLPPRYDGEHLRHLSHLSYNLWNHLPRGIPAQVHLRRA